MHNELLVYIMYLHCIQSEECMSKQTLYIIATVFMLGAASLTLSRKNNTQSFVTITRGVKAGV